MRNLVVRFILRFAWGSRHRIPTVAVGEGSEKWDVPRTLLDAESSGCAILVGVGLDAHLDLRLCECLARVVSVDPTPAAADYLATLVLPSNFTFVPVGLWSSSGRLQFWSPADPNAVSHSVLNLQSTGTVGFEAEVVTASELLDRVCVSKDDVAILKLDIEGAEHEVLPSALASGICPPFMLVELDQPVKLRHCLRLVRLMRSYGYALVRQSRFNFTLVLRR